MATDGMHNKREWPCNMKGWHIDLHGRSCQALVVLGHNVHQLGDDDWAWWSLLATVDKALPQPPVVEVVLRLTALLLGPQIQ
eukprot:6200402-Pleurochrysis_carterae.AAC.1